MINKSVFFLNQNMTVGPNQFCFVLKIKNLTSTMLSTCKLKKMGSIVIGRSDPASSSPSAAIRTTLSRSRSTMISTRWRPVTSCLISPRMSWATISG